MKTWKTWTISPLIYPAAILSAASLAWTTWSLVDLLGAGWIGITVAAGADIIWASVIVAEARGLRIAGRAWPVPALGWATLLVVAAFLAWHGLAAGSLAMAAAGPFLPLGAKAVWALALADMRDPTALTDDEEHQLAELERGMRFEEARHRIEMRRREMGAELLLTEVSTDFDIELTRQERARELHRLRPLALTASPGTATGTADTATAAAPDTPDTPPVSAGHPAHVLPGDTVTASGDALDLTGLTKADAVLRIKAAYPDAANGEIVKRLAAHGISTDTGYVRTALHRAAKRAAEKGEGFYP